MYIIVFDPKLHLYFLSGFCYDNKRYYMNHYKNIEFTEHKVADDTILLTQILSTTQIPVHLNIKNR